MAESIVIPVLFDTSKGLQALQPAQTGLNSITSEANKLKGTLGGVGNALQNALGGFARGAIVGAVTSLIATLATEFLNAGKKANFFGDAVRGATEKAGAEIFTLQALVAVAKDETASRESRNNAISQLQKQYPDYLRNISLETINSEAATKAIDDLTNSIFKKAVAQQLANKYAEKQVELLDAEKELTDEIKTAGGENGILKGIWQQIKSGGGIIGLGAGTAITSAAAKVKEIKDDMAEIKKLGTAAFGDALNFDKTPKPEKPKDIKVKAVKIKPEEILLDGVRFTRTLELAVPEILIDADDVRFKKHSEALPQIGNKPKGLESVAGDLARANEQIGLGIADAQRLGLIVSDTLTPSFTGFVDAIFSGADPLQSFFDGLIDSVNQLINKLIAAALQAAILSALGGGSFGGVFKTILGFAGGAANNTGFAGAQGMRVSVDGQLHLGQGGLVAAFNKGNTQISMVR